MGEEGWCWWIGYDTLMEKGKMNGSSFKKMVIRKEGVGGNWVGRETMGGRGERDEEVDP